MEQKIAFDHRDPSIIHFERACSLHGRNIDPARITTLRISQWFTTLSAKIKTKILFHEMAKLRVC